MHASSRRGISRFSADELPELPAAKNRFADEIIYRCLIRYPLWNFFERVRVQIHGPLPQASDGPLITYLTHPSWWDGHMCFLIDRLLLRHRFDSYLMMEDRQLRAYRFFTWCGAFSVSRSDPEAANRSVRYISRLFNERRGRNMYIFPQGKITPSDRRPIEAFPGAARVAEQVGQAMLLPVALRYEFRGEQRPEALMRIGPAHSVTAPIDVPALTAEIAQRLTASADALRDEAINGRFESYTTLLQGRPGVNRVFDTVLGPLVKKLTARR